MQKIIEGLTVTDRFAKAKDSQWGACKLSAAKFRKVYSGGLYELRERLDA